ncbi:Enoyl-[acyl-carrier-protein] reductase [NADH] FabI [Fundidesulfovibrio magnetotacticus]|uniref:Enoyl-[acyl-carrier-protein] reductase [NADH] n=1 Tax=Fundidesulfovibrio magnetotacticus TaxID=2730080 RepID=A0A6V8LTB0_9BACT|nr:enoyl-ACP reductase [Fundidesulfovibrio magnetotacticus]GFK95703.1 Enoyl-[acyl-carrier-protein] reductase [NADH] FabI [Fundidesulfovibrio magnetotacticus]
MLLSGKRALIFGVVNNRSIAYGIAKAFVEQGCRIGLSYSRDAVRKRILPIAEELGADFVVQCNVTSDEDIARIRREIAGRWDGLDVLVHSIAYANREDLAGRFIDTSREGFHVALDVSAFSLVALCKAFEELFAPEASVMTMSYYGAGRVVANYNAMGVAKASLECCVRYLAVDLGARGVRVNALSAGPVRTMAAAAIPGFRSILGAIEDKSPLRRNITLEDIGRCALYLASDLSSGTTGQTVFVDSGYNIMGI